MIADDHADIRARLARLRGEAPNVEMILEIASQQSVADPSVADPSPVDIADRQKLIESTRNLLAKMLFVAPLQAKIDVETARVECMAIAMHNEVYGPSCTPWGEETIELRQHYRRLIRAALAVYDEPKPMTATEILEWRERSFGAAVGYEEPKP